MAIEEIKPGEKPGGGGDEKGRLLDAMIQERVVRRLGEGELEKIAAQVQIEVLQRECAALQGEIDKSKS